ncbi:unnamed protein product, partial [Agarophyton chilense]
AAAGVVARPATGRFARRLRPAADAQQLIMLTREPDNEATALASARMRGNFTCAPLQPNRLEYWDNRFVVAAAPAAVLLATQSRVHQHGSTTAHAPLLRPDRVFAAALRPVDSPTLHARRMHRCSLYVRQLRRCDWQLITAVSARAATFHTPFECIRALPAVFQKPPHSDHPGHLVAVPHLGISARPDLCFVAVRLPRFRCLPPDLDPGFTPDHYHRWMAHSHAPRAPKCSSSSHSA